MTDAIDNIRRDRAALEAAIREAGSTIRGEACNCPHPAHEDRHPSASIHAGDDGTWRVTCHSRQCWGKGADTFDVRAALTGRPVADLLREARGSDAPRPRARPQTPPEAARAADPAPDLLGVAKACTAALTPERRDTLADALGVSGDTLDRLRLGWHADLGAWTFPMRDEAGRVVGIRTRTPAGDKRAVKGSRNGLFIPHDLPSGGTLWVVEGPTDAAALLDCGLAAIGRPSNNAGEDLIVEHVRRNPRDAVVIVTDRDTNPRTAQATADAADRLAARLVPLVGDVRVVQPPPPFKDARAACNAGAAGDDFEALADAAPSRGPAGELAAMLRAEADGRRRAVAWPWPLVGRATQALIPGTITLVVGDPGSGKSLWMLEALAHWHDAGLGVAYYALERKRAEHLKRALAQRTGAAWLTNLGETARRPDEAMAAHAEHAGWIDRFGRTIRTPGDAGVTLDELARWTAARAAEGARLVSIDPITVADTGPRPWDDARRFLRDAGRAVERHSASLVLVTHPAKTKGRPSGGLRTLEDLAGGTTWARFADSVVWLERHDEPRAVTVRDAAFPVPQHVESERTLRMLKARHGPGSGWQLAVTMDAATLRFHELGAIVKAATEAET